MDNLGKYNQAFVECVGASLEQLVGLKYQAIETWDSVGHMALMAYLEDEFGIMLEMDDILDFSSYEEGMSILLKYGVAL